MVEIPGYRVDRELGRGGMAVVYLAEQLSLRREVALKVLDPELAAGDPAFSRRFLREGRVAAALHHRHIVAVHDVGVHEGLAYLAMEYLPHGPVTPQAGAMAPREALRCLREIASALGHAHARGVVHRDVKPDNILCHEDGAFLLADFGIAHVVDASTVLTRENATAGTPAYMAPELWREGRVDARVDFYALGAVLYQLLTGEPPYQGEDGWAVGMQHMRAPVPQLPEAYQPLQGLLARLLAKEPLDRIGSSTELAAHIDSLEREGAVPERREGGPSPRAPTPRTSRLLREWPFRGDDDGAGAGAKAEADAGGGGGGDAGARPATRPAARSVAPSGASREAGSDGELEVQPHEPAWHEPLRAALMPGATPHVAALLLLRATEGHRLDEAAARRLLRSFHCRDIERGDGALTAEFHSAKEALECALRLLAAQGKRLRAALTLGDVARHEGRFVGRAVADAVAVIEHAAPGELAVSSAVQYTVVTPLHRALARHMRPAMARDDEAHAWVAPAAQVARAAAQVVPERGGWWAHGRLRAVLLLACLVLVAALAVWLPLRTPPAPPASVALLPFRSLEADPEADRFAGALALEVRNTLAAVPEVKVAAADAAVQDADARALGRRLNVAAVLEATVRREGERVRVSAQLTDTRSGFALWAHSYERPVAPGAGAQRQLAAELARGVVAALPSVESAAVATQSRDAVYDLYLRGRQLLDQGSGAAHLDAAVDQFEQALEGDPGFARAQAGICEAALRRYQRARDADALSSVQRACERAAAMDAELPEVAFAVAEFDRTRGALEAAQAGYERALVDPLLAVAAHLGLAQVAVARHEDPVAERHFEQAHALDKGDWRVPYQRGRFHLARMRLDAAEADFRGAIALASDDVASPWTNLGVVLLAKGDRDAASEALYRSVAIEPSQSALNNLATIRYELGDYGEAAALFRRAIVLAGDYRTRGNLADALGQIAGQQAASAAEYRRAASEAEAWLDSHPGDAPALIELAWYRANLGEREEAASLLARAVGAGEPAALALRAAEVSARIGDEGGARRWIDTALAAGHSPLTLQSRPVLRPLLAAPGPTQTRNRSGGAAAAPHNEKTGHPKGREP